MANCYLEKYVDADDIVNKFELGNYYVLWECIQPTSDGRNERLHFIGKFKNVDAAKNYCLDTIRTNLYITKDNILVSNLNNNVLCEWVDIGREMKWYYYDLYFYDGYEYFDCDRYGTLDFHE